MRRPGLVLICVLIMLIFFLPGCSSPQVSDRQIGLEIQMDTSNDFGLLLISYEIDGIQARGGVSNADHSLLKRDEKLFYALENPEMGLTSGPRDVNVQFTVVTEYVEPNYEEIYPEELLLPAGSVHIPEAEYGHTYSVLISGDVASGFSAALTGQGS